MLDHADYTAPTRQHELGCADQEYVSVLKDLDHELYWKSTICPISAIFTRQPQIAQQEHAKFEGLNVASGGGGAGDVQQIATGKRKEKNRIKEEGEKKSDYYVYTWYENS